MAAEPARVQTGALGRVRGGDPEVQKAWRLWPSRTLDGCEEAAIGLGEPALQSLGVGQYARSDRARRALDRACPTDPAYELVRCEKPAGWCLVVRRVCGARARAQAPRGAHPAYPPRASGAYISIGDCARFGGYYDGYYDGYFNVNHAYVPGGSYGSVCEHTYNWPAR
ncbi:MAG: hypothetical protein M3Y17_06920 [Actinomycetota bacterium]|nr:hypothetical protein [Actinomycetota bacterium]